MRKRILIAIALLLVLVPVAALLVLLYTQTGVELLAKQLGRLERIGVRVEGISGTLAGPLRVERFELTHPRVHVLVHDIVVDLELRGLMISTLQTASFTARNARVELHDVQMPRTDRPPRFLPPFLRIDARQVRIDGAQYIHTNGRLVRAERLTGRVTMTSRHLRVRDFDVVGPEFDARGNLHFTAARPFGLEGTAQGVLRLGDTAPLTVQATAAGHVERLRMKGELQAPSHATFEGELLRTDERWRIEGHVSSARFSLQPWWERPTFSLEQVELDVSLSPSEVRARGALAVPEFDVGALTIDARGAYRNRQLELQQSRLGVQGGVGALHARGKLLFDGGQPTLDVTGEWTRLQWPLRGEAVVESAAGSIALHGAFPYEFSTEATLSNEHLADMALRAQGSLSKEQLLVRTYDAQLLSGSMSGDARLDFNEQKSWALSAKASGIDPARVDARFPGRIAFNSAARGSGLSKRADFALSVDSLRGTLREQRLRGAGRISRSGRAWQVRDTSVSWGGAQMSLDAAFDRTVDARWSLDVPTLERLIPDARGSVVAIGTINGSRDTPHVVAKIEARDFRFGAWSASQLAVDADVDASNTQPSRLTVGGERVGYGNRAVARIDGRGEGTAGDHRIALDVIGLSEEGTQPPSAQMQIVGQLEKKVWHATINTTQFTRADPEQALRIVEPARAVVARDRASLENFCLAVGAGRICAGGQWQRDGTWEGMLSGYEIPLSAVLPRAEEGVEYLGRIEGSARAFGSPTQPWQGEAGMKISDAAIVYRPQGAEPERLNLGTGGLHLVAGSTRIDFSFGVQAFTDTYVHTDLHLQRDGTNDLLHLPLTGELRARAADANLLPVLFPEVDHAAGILMGNARLSGTLAAPEINGRFQLTKGELDSYRVNFALRDVDVVANLANTGLQFKGRGRAGEGVLDLNGDFTWRDGRSSGELSLRGENLLIADLPEYRVVASPDLQFQIDGQDLLAKGVVVIPSARLQPAQLSGAVRTSEDARYIGEHPAEREGRLRVSSDIRIVMGEDVRIDTFGLQGKVTGAVATHVETGETPTGRGELAVAEGRYEAYGQKLDINRGRLLFDTSPLDDPGLDIEARRTIETITVGLNVRGTLQEPRLTFFSDPSMPQTQIVSYLLVGKPSDSLQRTEPGAGNSMNALAFQGGGFLASQLGRRLGLEEVGVESTLNSAGETNTALVLGKFLSPRLFISYGISLTESINTLKMRYTISDRWILRSESGEAQSADLEYTIER